MNNVSVIANRCPYRQRLNDDFDLLHVGFQSHLATPPRQSKRIDQFHLFGVLFVFGRRGVIFDFSQLLLVGHLVAGQAFATCGALGDKHCLCCLCSIDMALYWFIVVCMCMCMCGEGYC